MADTDRLSEIKDEVKDLIIEAISIVRQTDEYDRAKGYWYAHIRGALDSDHSYLGGSMVTLQDTIDSLE